MWPYVWNMEDVRSAMWESLSLVDQTDGVNTFRTPTAAPDLKAHAEILTGRPVTQVLNTRCRNDHTRVNQVFSPEVDIVATKLTRDQLNKDILCPDRSGKGIKCWSAGSIVQEIKTKGGRDLKEAELWLDYYLAMEDSLDELTIALPNRLIAAPLTLSGSIRSLQIIPKPGGHTDGDLLVWMPEDKIVFMGDQLFVQRYPYLGEGDLNYLSDILQWVSSTLDPMICVPGHGSAGQKDDLDERAPIH
ncbi:MAG: hypothetical protein IPL46_24475 [Saprospiraceae bacterium]|nr:hypothetical protein [Saprospiraceae bacterium]